MVDAVDVSTWRHLSGTTWARVGGIKAWQSINLELRYLQPGSWSVLASVDEQTEKVTEQTLVTFDVRGTLYTGLVEHIGPQGTESNGVVLELSGSDALGLLGDVPCAPVPSAGLSGQTVAHYVAKGPAETVLRNLIVANYVPWYAGGLYPMVVAPSQGRGTTASLSERYSSLLQVVTDKCDLAGIGVRVGLKLQPGSNTRADLTCEFFTPQDKSVRVRLSHKVGTLRSWSQSDDVPTATRAIVGDGGNSIDRAFRQVVADEAEARWGRRRFTFVDSSDTFDATTMDENGLSALSDAASQSSFDLQAADADGMRFGDHYNLGDKVTIELLTGLSKVDVLRGVVITADSTGWSLQLKPGNPDAGDPLFAQAAILSNLRRRLRKLEQEK